MTSQPVILVLEDEKPQLLALRAALEGLGELREFADPDSALGFIRQHTADAAIVDVHMPDHNMDGMQFIRSVREFDGDLSVIIRTGDDSVELADDAIEVRAFRRAVKGRTSIDELRALTVKALTETRSRRRLTQTASKAESVRTQLTATLGSVEDELSVTDAYKAMLQGMRNTLTAIAGYAEVLCEATDRGGSTFLRDQAARNRTAVERLLTDVIRFLDGPYAESLRATQTQRVGTANGVLESVRKRFLASPQWLADGKSLHVLGLSQDMYVSVAPIKLLTALRHLIEYCMQRSLPDSILRLTAYCVESATVAIEETPGPKLILRRRALSELSICVVFRLRADLAATSLEEIRRAFHQHPEDPRSGNLQMIGMAMGDEPAAVVARTGSSGAFVFEFYVPTGH